MATTKNSVVHEATGVNVDVLLKDAQTLGIDVLANLNTMSLGKICQDLYRNIGKVTPYPSRDNFTTYNVYKGGKVIGLMVTSEVCDQLKKDNATWAVEPVIDEDGYDKVKAAYWAREALISQVFNWGLFYVNDLLDNKKAQKAFNLAWEQGHHAGYYKVASHFDDLIDLIN
jgi:hypothetical protein